MNNGHYYSVSFGCELGKKLKDYFERCTNADRAASEFAKATIERFRLNIPERDIDVCYSDDCEAGGLLAISVPRFDPDTLPHELSAMKDNDDCIFLLPSIEASSHYIPYKTAERLAKNNRKDWSFRTDAKGVLTKFLYKDVKHKMPLSDRRLLFKNEPTGNARLALGTHYAFHTDIDIPINNRINQSHTEACFDDALQFYLDWKALPTVTAYTLVKILHLEYKGDITNRRVALSEIQSRSYCHWRVDSKRGRYLFHTGLTSSDKDMIPEDPSGMLGIFLTECQTK